MMLFQLNEFCGEFETIQENFLASARLPDPSFCITCIDPPGITALTLPTRYCALAVGEIWIEKWLLSTGRTDRWTFDRYIDPALLEAGSISNGPA